MEFKKYTGTDDTCSRYQCHATAHYYFNGRLYCHTHAASLLLPALAAGEKPPRAYQHVKDRILVSRVPFDHYDCQAMLTSRHARRRTGGAKCTASAQYRIGGVYLCRHHAALHILDGLSSDQFTLTSAT